MVDRGSSRAGASLWVIAIAGLAGLAGPALAQSEPGSDGPAVSQNAPPAGAAQAANPDVPKATATTETDNGEIVVTGFRNSLAKALNLKKDETGAVDSILAEDIGKFPDLNLSESIQRIPGVALLRDGGEGRSISVRGLGPQFTRVRINGMEAIATTGGSDPSGGTNRGRGFDFNVFASDLFNAITVRKTAQAETEEGSLGATVDLRTARPFDYHGFTMTASAQGSYNDLSKDAEPRAAFLISDTFADDTIGVLFSAAYTKRKLIESGFSTVRWAPNTAPADASTAAGSTIFFPGFQSVLGTQCQNAAGTANLAGIAVCDAANQAFHPRFPRYDYFIDNQRRLGFTGSIQWAPSDRTLVSIDGLYADFKATREERYLEANGLSVSGACTAASRPTNCGVPDIDVVAEKIVDRTLVSGTFNDVDIRAENRFDKLDTKFKQLTFDGSQKLGDTLTMTALAGYSSSNHTNPVQNTVTFDQYNIQGYSYDFTNSRSPVFNFGSANLANSNGWVLSQIRLRSATAKNTYRTGQLGLDWKPVEGFELLGGGDYKRYGFSTSFLQRSVGTTASQDTNVACCTAVPLASYGHVVSIEGQSFFDPNYFAANDVFHFSDTSASNFGGAFRLGPEPGLSSNNSVKEEDKAGFVQGNFHFPIGEMTLRGDAGVRYVRTHQDANGFVFTAGNSVPVTVSRSYHDWLPAANLVLEVTDKFQVRAAAAKVMARPDLGSLPPGVAVAVSGANKTVTAGNPDLDPYRAKTYDLAFEYYYAKGALISLALFQKDIKSFVQTLNSSGPFSSNPFGLPDSVANAACGSNFPATCSAASNWVFSQPRNGPGGKLKGFEVNYQQPLRFLPWFLTNTGVLVNYTRVTSKIKYLDANSNVVAVNDLTGLSRNAYNATLYYEDTKFSARVSAAYRSKYLTRVPGQQGTDIEGTNSTLNVDASIQYTLSDHFKLTLEGINLTDEHQDQFVDSRNLLSVYHHTGREYLFGVRYSY